MTSWAIRGIYLKSWHQSYEDVHVHVLIQTIEQGGEQGKKENPPTIKRNAILINFDNYTECYLN